MRLLPSSIIIFTCISCLGLCPVLTRADPGWDVIAKKPVSTSYHPKAKPAYVVLILWLSLGLGVLGSTGFVLYLIRQFSQKPEALDPVPHENATPQLDPVPHENATPQLDPVPHENATPQTQLLPIEKTSRLAKFSIVDELIKDLRSPDPAKRSKAIWDLGQQGDSRAIQPLADLMIDADSQEHSLILAALAEIGIRTLKPMNRALSASMQDDSPQVRQNAIRDLARLYDMMGQMSQMLRHAVEDTDPQVQATAKYALNHLQRMRGVQDQPSSSADSPPE